MANVTIELLEPKLGGEITRVVIRPPKAAEYWRIGEPERVVRTNDTFYTVDDEQALGEWLKLLLVEPDSRAYLDNLGLADAMRIKEAIIGFFDQARQRIRSAAPNSSPSI